MYCQMYGRQHHQRISNKTHRSVIFDSVAYATGSMIEWCASYANKEFFMKKKCVASLATMALLAAALVFVACKNVEEGGEIQQPPAPEQGSGGNGSASQGGEISGGEQKPGGNENLGGTGNGGDTELWSIKSDGKLTKYNGNETNVTIPDGVTSIADGAFSGHANITVLTIPASVTSIGYSAFYNCTNLTEIQFEGTVAQWEAITGSNVIGIPGISCSDGVIGILGVPSYLKISGTEVTGYTDEIPEDLVIPDGVTGIKQGAFYNCATLNSVTIPDSVTSIEWCGGYPYHGAFEGCANLKIVTMGDGLTSIGKYAFKECTSIEKVTYNGTLAQWCGIDRGDFYATPLWCGNVVLYIGSEELTVADIPDGVTEIKDCAFLNCKNLTSVTIPDSVTSIGNYAFQGCAGLTSMNIPASVTSIGNSVFVDCSNLASITVDDSNPSYSIQDGILYNKDKTSLLYVPQDIMGNIAILDSVTYIAENAFYACKDLRSVTIPDSVTSIGEGAFSDCTNLREMTLPFVGASKGDTSNCLGYIFGGTDNTVVPHWLEEVIILDGITSIGEDAFNGCSYLRSVTIPDSVTSIGKGAFSGCINLREMTLPFAGATKNGRDNTYFDYIFGGTTTWSGTPSNKLAPSSLKKITITGSIGDYAFYGCKGLTNVTIGDGVSSIGNSAFVDCSGLTSITIPNSVSVIGAYAFKRCTSLATVTMSAFVQVIKTEAFCGCMALMNIIFKGTPAQWDAIEKGSSWDYSTGGVEGYWEHKWYTVTYEY